jgi:hypothetical protein
MSLLSDHLCVPFGLAIDNTRDFILDEGDPLDDEEKHFAVAPEFTLDYMYDSMVLYPTKKTHRITMKKPHKKKN